MAFALISMTDDQFTQLRQVIYERSGIDFKLSKKYVLESRLSRRVEDLGFENFDQYILFLTTGPYQQDEFQEMFNRVTINETSFFRNPQQLEVFENRVLPRLLEARQATRTLRFWSAACSSGEEPYSLAIQVHRSLGLRLSQWNVEILGTDISEKVLLDAQRGLYTSHSFRDLSPLVMQRYFKPKSNLWQIDPEIQKMVHFERLNLKESLAARRFGKFDVIFCRNVLIYFDDPMRLHCIKLFHSQLASDGVLFLGHSETLRNQMVPFTPLPEPQAFAYAPAA